MVDIGVRYFAVCARAGRVIPACSVVCAAIERQTEAERCRIVADGVSFTVSRCRGDVRIRCGVAAVVVDVVVVCGRLRELCTDCFLPCKVCWRHLFVLQFNFYRC